MNPRILTGTALALALAAGTIAAAGAQTTVAPGAPMPMASGRTQGQSNGSIAKAANRVGMMISALQKDDKDYGGHRVTAISDLTNAQNELNAAAQYADSHGYGSPGGANGGPEKNEPKHHAQSRSNYQIAHVQQSVEKMITHLQADDKDYGGHRANALNWLNQANTELTAAVQYEQSHPNG